MLLFISDLHLDASRPKVAEAFFHFLQHEAINADALYILGDLFELWVGDDDDDPFVIDVQQQLKQFSQQVPALYFMHGNRDFLIGTQFAEASGARLLKDPTVIEIDGENVVLMHGDLLCTNDTAYQAFRNESRSQAWMDNVLSRSLEERRALGRQLRQQSKTMSSRKAEDIMDVSVGAVVDIMQQHSASKLIHGHTHRPARHSITVNNKPVERIVLGDWDSKAWCLRYDGDWELLSWLIE